MTGPLWLPQTSEGQHPSLIPGIPMDNSDWDTSIVPHEVSKLFEAERRHSGWAAVEERWVQPTTSQSTRPPEDRKPPQATEATGKLNPALSLPPPQLEADFRLRVLLNPTVATMAVSEGHKNWTTVTEGVWSGTVGSGTVVGGGQDSIDMGFGNASGTQIESVFKLKTDDEPPALIECRARGVRTGPADVMQALRMPAAASAQSLDVDPRRYRHRVLITMRTSDDRYAEKVNFELWVGTGLWRGTEVVYDAYKVR